MVDAVQRPFLPVPRVATVDETIDHLMTSGCSFVRFGDGEMTLIKGQSINFQRYSPELQERLKQVLSSDVPGLDIGIAGAFGDLSKLADFARRFLQAEMGRNRRLWLRLLNLNRQYYEAGVTRLYIGRLDVQWARERFERLKSLWAERPVLVIEGQGTRFGIGNDLLAGATQVRRIVCPARHAYDRYPEILATAREARGDSLVLVALGPAAKPLTYDLHLEGARVLDVGHLDVEYEWLLREAKTKIPIPGKHVNEARDGHEYGEIDSPEYQSQIVANLS